MDDLASFEHLLERVTLVKGVGNRRQGELCVMSFVALLSGERHTDAPGVVSPFIRHFAIALNDAIPDEERQRLKLFAPRMLHTNDQFDSYRGHLLIGMITNEILPTISGHLETTELPSSLMFRDRDFNPKEIAAECLDEAHRAVTRGRPNSVATQTCSLLVALANAARTERLRRWYWAKALDTLDRLCDVGTHTKLTSADTIDVEAALFALDHSTLRIRIVLTAKRWLAVALEMVQAAPKRTLGQTQKVRPSALHSRYGYTYRYDWLNLGHDSADKASGENRSVHKI